MKEGQGRIIYINGNTYEGGWKNDRKDGYGRMVDFIRGLIFSGEYTEGKRNGFGRIWLKESDQIYEGEWAQDRKQGEGILINRNGVVVSGEFRADHMEGKSQIQKKLSKFETDLKFNSLINSNDMFITVPKTT